MEAEEGSETIPVLQEVIEDKVIRIDQDLMEDVVVHLGEDQMEEAAHLEADQDHQIEVEVLPGREDPDLLEEANNQILLLNWS